MDTIQELKNKLNQDQRDLQELELMLESDPHSEELLGLKSELITLIKQSSDLIVTKTRELESLNSGNNVINNTTTINNNNNNNNNSNNNVNNNNIINPTTAVSASTAINSTTENGIIINHNNNNYQLKLQNRLQDKIQSMFQVGSKCEGKYGVDGIWYPATIKEINVKLGTYTVVYDVYENVETLTIDNIRPPSRVKIGEIGGGSSNVPPPTTIKTPNVIQDKHKSIPKSSRILPEDSEEVKLKKKKEQRAVYNNNRLQRVEEESKKKKQDWKDFQNATKKSVPGTFTDRKKTSIFSTPDNIHGKVGVIGSGRGMTQVNNSFSMNKKPLNGVPN